MIKHAFSGWFIYTGKELPVARLLDKNGKPIGVLMGVGVDACSLITDSYRIDTLDVDQPGFFRHFESWLNYVAGRYNILLSQNGTSRFYSDPAGTNGMIFDVLEQQVASSLALCIERPIQDHPLYDHGDIERGNGNYSLFHTRDVRARRGNPSCYLDLQDFSEHRFWPGPQSFNPNSDPRQDIYTELVANTQHVIREINASYTTALPLSGGQDSRLLASMAGPELANIDQIFTHIHNYASRIDATIAGKIAQILGVKHQVFDRRNIKPKAVDVARSQAEFETALGFSRPQLREMEQGLHMGLTDGAVVLRGHQTDLLRAVFIDRLGEKPRRYLRWQVKRLMIVPPKQFTKEVYKSFVPEYENWIKTLPAASLERQVDLMFLEIYYSSTIGQTFPALSRNFYMSPFNSRHMIELSLSLEETYRKRSDAVNDILLMTNPAVHDVPFDYEFPAKDGLHLIDDEQFSRELTAPRRAESHARARTLVAGSIDFKSFKSAQNIS